MQMAQNGVELTPHGAARLEKKIIREGNGFRAESFVEFPFWAIQAAKLKVIVVFDGQYRGKPLPTAMTDGRVLVINAPYWESLMPDTRKTLFQHELGHNVLGHSFRRGDRNFKKFNIAGDHEINLILQEMGMDIPSNWLCDEDYKGMSAERIFMKIPDEGGQGPRKPPEDEGGDGPCPEEKDPSDTEPEEIGEEEPEGHTSKPGDKEGKPDDAVEPDKKGEPLPPGEFWDPTGPDGDELTEEEKSKELGQLKEDTTMAELASKARGIDHTPSMKRSLDRLRSPKLDWRSHINRWVQQRGKPIGRTWSKLDRRSMEIGIFQPGEVKDGIDIMRVYVDVSSSICSMVCAITTMIVYFTRTTTYHMFTIITRYNLASKSCVNI